MKKIIIESDFNRTFTVYAVTRYKSCYDISLHTSREDAEGMAKFLNEQEETDDHYVYERTVFHNC